MGGALRHRRCEQGASKCHWGEEGRESNSEDMGSCSWLALSKTVDLKLLIHLRVLWEDHRATAAASKVLRNVTGVKKAETTLVNTLLESL